MKISAVAILLLSSLIPNIISAQKTTANGTYGGIVAPEAAPAIEAQVSDVAEMLPLLPYRTGDSGRIVPPLAAVDEDAAADGVERPSMAEALTDFAATLLGRKYVWGATGPKTFDCSGFTGYVFRSAGIELPRTSRMQYAQGEKVERSELQAGDLMFFSSPRSGRGRVGHVGMVVSVDESGKSVTFIHASTKKGITYQKFPDGGYYSRNYIGAKRVIPADGVA